MRWVEDLVVLLSTPNQGHLMRISGKIIYYCAHSKMTCFCDLRIFFLLSLGLAARSSRTLHYLSAAMNVSRDKNKTELTSMTWHPSCGRNQLKCISLLNKFAYAIHVLMWDIHHLIQLRIICIQHSHSPFKCIMGIMHMREASFALCTRIESSPIYTLFVFIQINYEILPLKLIIFY